MLELNWNQRFRDKKAVKICSLRPHNCKTGHFTSKNEKRTCKACNFSFSDMQILTFLLPSSSWLLKDQNGKQIITLSPPYSHSVNEQSTYNPGKCKLLGRPFKLLKNVKKK